MIHLDTSFLIHALVPSSPADGRLRAWLRSGETLGISAVAWAEFLCGPVRDVEIAATTGLFEEITPYTAVDSETTAQFFNRGGRRRGSLADCMIAAVAVRAGAALATVNPGDFRRFAPAALTIVEP